MLLRIKMLSTGIAHDKRSLKEWRILGQILAPHCKNRRNVPIGPILEAIAREQEAGKRERVPA